MATESKKQPTWFHRLKTWCFEKKPLTKAEWVNVCINIVKLITAISVMVVSIIALWISSNANRIANDANDVAGEANLIANAANQIAEKSNQIAYEALEIHKDMFQLENKPILSIKIEKTEPNKYYYKAKLSDNGKTAYIGIRFEVRNYGRAIATNMHVSATVTNMPKAFDPDAIESRIEIPFKATLAPGETCSLYWMAVKNFGKKEESERFINNVDKILSEDHIDVLMGRHKEFIGLVLNLEYVNELEPKQWYRSLVEYRITKKQTDILRHEYVMIEEPNNTLNMPLQ